MLGLTPALWLSVLSGSAAVGLGVFAAARPWADHFPESSSPVVSAFPVFKNMVQSRQGPLLAAAAALGWMALWLWNPMVGLSLTAFMGLAFWGFRALPRWRKNRSLRIRRAQCLEAFPQSLEMIVQSLQTGQTVPQTLSYLAKEAPSPLQEEFRDLCVELELGSTPEDALARWADRLDHPDLHQFLESYRLSRKTGANLVHLYRVQLEGIEERQRILRRMDSMTAQARLSGLLMGSLPFILLGVLFVMDPDLLTPLFDRPLGWAVLGLAAFLEVLGFAWIKKLLRLDL